MTRKTSRVRVKIDSRLNEFAKNHPSSSKTEKLKILASKINFMTKEHLIYLWKEGIKDNKSIRIYGDDIRMLLTNGASIQVNKSETEGYYIGFFGNERPFYSLTKKEYTEFLDEAENSGSRIV